MTVEEFREQAIKNGTFDKLKTQNVVLILKDNIKTTGFLDFLRKVFPDNYVGKEGRRYTIYTGDKETQKKLNTHIHFYNHSDEVKELKEEMNKLKRHDEDTRNKE